MKCEVHEHVHKHVIRCTKKHVPRFLILEALLIDEWSNGFWKLVVTHGHLKMVNFGNWINNFINGKLLKSFLGGQRKGSVYINFYLKQNEGVQCDLHVEIFMFLSFSSNSSPGKWNKSIFVKKSIRKV